MRLFVVSLGLCMMLAAGCAKKVTVPTLPTLDVAFADPAWTGDMVPEGQQCRQCGGDGATPSFVVTRMPAGATDLVILYWDGHSHSGMTKPGDHGGVRVKITNNQRMVTPAVPGQTMDMPEGVTAEKVYKGGAADPGAYLPPCACLAKQRSYHKYYARIQAVDANGKVLAEKTVMIGKFKD